MEIVKEKGLNLKYASDTLRNDKDIVKEAVTQNGTAIQFASREIQDDKEIVMIALEGLESEIESGGMVYYCASERLKNDKDIVMKAVLQSLNYPGHVQFSYVSEDKLYAIFNNDRELLLKISNLNRISTLKYACSELRNDKEFVLKVIQQYPDAFRCASDELKSDREFVKESVKVNGRCLIYTSDQFRDDREIVELALKSYPTAISVILDRFRNDIEFISNSIGKGGFIDLPTEFSNDREIVLESIKLRYYNFQKASHKLKHDREFILQAVKYSGRAWIYIDHEYHDDEEFIIQASQCQTMFKLPIFYHVLSDRLKNDRELFKKCGGLFRSFPKKYQIDREIVMEV